MEFIKFINQQSKNDWKTMEHNQLDYLYHPPEPSLFVGRLWELSHNVSAQTSASSPSTLSA